MKSKKINLTEAMLSNEELGALRGGKRDRERSESTEADGTRIRQVRKKKS